MKIFCSIAISISVFVLTSYSESLRTDYFKRLQYYSLSQLVEKNNYIDAVRFLYNPGGIATDGDVCITLYRNETGIRQQTLWSEKNLWICLGASNDSTSIASCDNGIEKEIDTLKSFIEIYEEIAELIQSSNSSKSSSMLFDGKFCIVEYATKESIKKVELIPIDDNDNVLHKVGALFFLITKCGKINVSQKWMQDLTDFQKEQRFTVRDIKKRLVAVLK